MFVDLQAETSMSNDLSFEYIFYESGNRNYSCYDWGQLGYQLGYFPLSYIPLISMGIVGIFVIMNHSVRW